MMEKDKNRRLGLVGIGVGVLVSLPIWFLLYYLIVNLFAS